MVAPDRPVTFIETEPILRWITPPACGGIEILGEECTRAQITKAVVQVEYRAEDVVRRVGHGDDDGQDGRPQTGVPAKVGPPGGRGVVCASAVAGGVL